MHGQDNTKKVATNVHHLTRLEVLITVLTKIQVLRKIIGRLSSWSTLKMQMASSSETSVTNVTVTYATRGVAPSTILFTIFINSRPHFASGEAEENGK
jgi:hypothetical protein